MAYYRVLDIETVPDRTVWTPPPPKWKAEPRTSELVAMEDGRLLAETAWVEEEPFPPAFAHRVVAIAMVELSGDDNRWYSYERSQVECGWGYGGTANQVERTLLEAFSRLQTADGATLVTWNGRQFDLPVLNLRSFKHGIPCPWYYQERDVRYRYTEAGHCDLMDVLSDYGASRSIKLDDAAKLLGLSGKTGDVKGADIAGIYESLRSTDGAGAEYDKMVKKIADYCLSDTLQTAAIFAATRLHKGMIDQDYYRSVVVPSFAEVLSSQGVI